MNNNEKLKAWMTRNGLNPKDAAKILGVSRNTVYGWRKNKIHPGFRAVHDSIIISMGRWENA